MQYTIVDKYFDATVKVSGVKSHKKALESYLKDTGTEFVKHKTVGGFYVTDEDGVTIRYAMRAIPSWLGGMQIKPGCSEAYDKARTKEEILKCVEPIKRRNTILTNK